MELVFTLSQRAMCLLLQHKDSNVYRDFWEYNYINAILRDFRCNLFGGTYEKKWYSRAPALISRKVFNLFYCKFSAGEPFIVSGANDD